MFNFILLFISVVAAAMAVAGLVILLRPVKQAESPVKAPADVITVMSVDTDSPSEEPEEIPSVPMSAMERELELSDLHEGDIVVGTEPSPEVEEAPIQTHDVQEEAPSPDTDPIRPEEPSDVVSKSIPEEPEEGSGTPPDRPLELIENQTY